ncbi:MAG: hypothetical protein LC800_00250 [Acidobacteria bacterium]|nr:hypothetical protein [Acidobacteriota bacterium]
MIEKRLGTMAGEANETTSGGLDIPETSMTRMPTDLRDVRKKRIGRHRVFYTGYHTLCSYRSFYLKVFKKNDRDREDDAAFQAILRHALTDPPTRTLPDPTQPPRPDARESTSPGDGAT